MDPYRKEILDHYKNPRNFGHLAKPDVKEEESLVSCGDRIVMEIQLSVRPATEETKVQDIRFSGEGCAISQASASMLTEKVKRMEKRKIMRLSTPDVLAMLGTTLTPSRIKCAILPLEVLQKAVAKAR